MCRFPGIHVALQKQKGPVVLKVLSAGASLSAMDTEEQIAQLENDIRNHGTDETPIILLQRLESLTPGRQ